MLDVPVERFEELVADALGEIPDDLWRMVDNVAVVVREGIEGSSLLGLYDGIPLTERDAGYTGMVMQDRISIFRR
jgi:predicted Zn-dependent protease with MMP-like domain